MMQSIAQATIQVIPSRDLQARPIRIGTTTELAIFPQGSNFDARNFMCRVSTATLTAGGDFTKFDGYQRILALVSGAGMQLSVDGKNHSITEPFQSIRFPGDVPTNSKLLSSTITDFNVIFRPSVDAAYEKIPLNSMYFSLRQRTLGAPSSTSIRVDVLWSPDTDLEVEAGRQRVTVDRGGVFILRHAAKMETSLQVRAPGNEGNVLLVSLRMPNE